MRADADQHQVFGLDRARGVLRVLGLPELSEAGSRKRAVMRAELRRASRAFGARSRTGFPRHSILSIAPGSILLMSISTGAPSALARALGFQDARNGTAANATPDDPVSVVATVRSWRLPLSIASLIGRFSFVGGIAALYTAITRSIGGGRAHVGHSGLVALDFSLGRARTRGGARIRVAAAGAASRGAGARRSLRRHAGEPECAAVRRARRAPPARRIRELCGRGGRDRTGGRQHLYGAARRRPECCRPAAAVRRSCSARCGRTTASASNAASVPGSSRTSTATSSPTIM